MAIINKSILKIRTNQLIYLLFIKKVDWLRVGVRKLGIKINSWLSLYGIRKRWSIICIKYMEMVNSSIQIIMITKFHYLKFHPCKTNPESNINKKQKEKYKNK
jgi:hypothetical protein